MAHTEVTERYSIQLGNRGRLVLPAEVQHRRLGEELIAERRAEAARE
ncbi:MAG: hypothetical protein ACREXW_02460 [Gammaproteobacteria bacterium]